MEFPWLFRGCLIPPTYRVALLPTPALERLKIEGAACKVVLVTAPAGAPPVTRSRARMAWSSS